MVCFNKYSVPSNIVPTVAQLRTQQQLQRLACILQACARLIFREQSLVHGLSAYIVHLVGNTREIGIDPSLNQVVVHLVEEVA